MELQVPSIEVPAQGPIRVHTPPLQARGKWILDVVGWRNQVRTDQDGEGGITLHRRHLPVVLQALTEKYGSVDLYRQYEPEERCTPRCQKAGKPECTCSCAGERHGEAKGASWLEGKTAGEYVRVGTGADDWSHTRITSSEIPLLRQ